MPSTAVADNSLVEWRGRAIALLAAAGIAVHLTLRYLAGVTDYLFPLYAVLALGGIPLLAELIRAVAAGRFGSDLLAGISIVASVLVHEYLAGAIIVLMWSGGSALEQYASGRASAALRALADRMPRFAHLRGETGWTDIALDQIEPGNILIVLPHETCPADGYVEEGHGHMDESYLTGEPYRISKAPGAQVLSGALNGETALTVIAARRNSDSRYARILKVLASVSEHQPRIRRLSERLGAWYTPVALAVAVAGWAIGDDPRRFLAVLVIATPCPLLVAIPIAVIGSIAVAARRGIVIRNPAALELVDRCQTFILDKTGTLTEGKPTLTEIVPAAGHASDEVLQFAAALEQYSRHPLAAAVLEAARARRIENLPVDRLSERPGEGLTGSVRGSEVRIVGRNSPLAQASELPPLGPGLECLIFLDGKFAALLRFRDEPRAESRPFLSHLLPHHRVTRILLVSGDRESEVNYLAARVGISEVYAGKSPEEKVAIVRSSAAHGSTLFVGDGINDAPAMLAATVGVALGKTSDVTSEAADAVILDGSLPKVDEFIHIGTRMRRIAWQSAMGGMAASVVGMMLAASGHLTPVAGAVTQEIIDLLAVLNALRCAFPPANLGDFS